MHYYCSAHSPYPVILIQGPHHRAVDMVIAWLIQQYYSKASAIVVNISMTLDINAKLLSRYQRKESRKGSEPFIFNK